MMDGKLTVDVSEEERKMMVKVTSSNSFCK
jgi:hypothetical protein